MFQVLTYADLHTRLLRSARDPDNNRWTSSEIYSLLNAGVEHWSNRVMVPYVYEFSYAANTREYTMPTYVTLPIDIQFQDPRDEWQDIIVYDLIKTGGGTVTFKLLASRRPDAGRVIWWGKNSIAPLSTPTLQANIDADDTSLIIDDTVIVNDVGTVKIDQEYIQYAGVTLGASSTTLNNLVRGALGTTADSHSLGANVYWSVVVHRADLFQELEYFALMRMHELFLTDGSAHEMETHERMMNWFRGMVEDFWKKYTPARSPKWHISEHAIGTPFRVGRVFPAGGDRASYP